MFKKRAVMGSYLDLASNAYIADAYFQNTESESFKWNP